MKNLGIKARVILLGTIPGVLFAIILAGYAITKVFNILDESLYDRGRIIASQMAPAAEYGVVSGNAEILQKLTQQALGNEQQLRSVVITDVDNQQLALSGRELDSETIANFKTKQITEVATPNGIVFIAPIYRTLLEVDDFSLGAETKSARLNSTTKQLKVGNIYVELSNLGLQKLKQELVFKLLLIGLFGLIVSAIIAWKIGRNITKPIQEIAYAVNQLGEGVFSHAILESSSGELRVLQKGFNSMSTRLKNAYDHMQDKIHDATVLLRHQAQHDDLTGLINRREFEVRLQSCLKSVVEQKKQHVFCYMDLDQFKLVNDTCGHNAGDELLRQVSTLFINKMRDRDTLARLGGDEFGILLENSSLEEAIQITEKILKMVRDYRFVHEDKVFNIGVSIGIVLINSHFQNISDIMHAADAACYSAKNAGRNQSFLYSQSDVETVKRHTAVQAISDITDEIDDDRFALYCQPIVPLFTTDSSHHYEVLIRRVDLEGEVSLPTTFIPSAERYHLMPNIDRWVIKNTFAAYRRMLNLSHEKCDYTFSINLSGTSLGDKNLLSYIREMFATYAIPPKSICFEITETAAIVNLKNTLNLFSALRKIGCQFALDDFGSGMSSFMYLKNFEVDYIKIDGSFVKEMDVNKIDHAMVRSIQSVAEAMNIKTVAEFVENEAILKQLKIIGVQYGQGNYLGLPVSIKKMIENFAIINT